MAPVLTHGLRKYAPWEELTSRTQEVDNVTEAPGMKIVETPDGGAAFVPLPQNEGSADLSGEMRWDLALQRRGIAMEVAGLLTYESHSLWHQSMKTTYLRTPPPGYRQPTWAQLRNADRELWRCVSSACPTGFKPEPGAAMTAFEAAWIRLMTDPKVVHFFLPFPFAVGASASSSPSSSSLALLNPASDRARQLENQMKNKNEQIVALKRRLENQGGGKGKRPRQV